MKKKKIHKRLGLKKTTIANLNVSDMLGMKGGTDKPSNPFICGTGECYYTHDSEYTYCDCDPGDSYGTCGPTVDPNETCVPCTYQTQCDPCNP